MNSFGKRDKSGPPDGPPSNMSCVGSAIIVLRAPFGAGPSPRRPFWIDDLWSAETLLANQSGSPLGPNWTHLWQTFIMFQEEVRDLLRSKDKEDQEKKIEIKEKPNGEIYLKVSSHAIKDEWQDLVVLIL